MNKHNKLNMLEKLKNVVSRNFASKEIRTIPNHPNGPFFAFKESSNQFGSFEFLRLFNYWGVDWRDAIKEFRVHSEIKETDEGYPYIEREVIVWLNELPDPKTCNHEFNFMSGWQNDVCKKCGFFKESEN